MDAPSGTLPRLTTKDLDAVLRVLEECECAATITDFRDSALEALARFLDYRHTTFFLGPSLPQMFADKTPRAHGLPHRMLSPYVEKYCTADVFAQPRTMRLLAAHGVVTLDQVTKPLRQAHEEYLNTFLFRNGAYAKMAISLNLPSGYSAAIGVIDSESGRFGRHDMAISQILSRHLGNLLRMHLPVSSPPSLLGTLTASQLEIVRLVSLGLTNAEIAATKHVTVATVKKHLTNAMRTLGSGNRTQLALLFRQSSQRTR